MMHSRLICLYPVTYTSTSSIRIYLHDTVPTVSLYIQGLYMSYDMIVLIILMACVLISGGGLPCSMPAPPLDPH